ncbi:MAG TPA: hypothetical protein VGN16_03025 [Acidobacteriaceae bacterium]
MSVLDDASAARFRESVERYLRRTVPDVCAGMSDLHITQSVTYAIAICRAYGLTRQVDVLRYINLMYVYGFGFDADPRYPWAARILSDRSLSSAARLDWLCSHATYEAARQGAQHV